MFKLPFLNQQGATTSSGPTKLGAFGGVYTPSILTILGVLMYQRFSWVVGNVGLWGTLLIVTLSTLITFLTGLSISAIATDREVGGGGAYYMISRSLGLETGGAVGIPLYFAQALSVALYTIGFAESVVAQFEGLNQVYLALGATIFITAVAWISANASIKVQYLIMAAIAFSLISFFLGSPEETTNIEAWGAPKSDSEPFWEVFAVFFPAVTGIMAGVNMSGDLKSPAKAIPVGTLGAIATGYLVYMILPIVLANRADAITLIEQRESILRETSRWEWAILMGVWGATLSSALGSMLGAPRILQALARDRILPRWMRFVGKGSGVNDEPRVGITVTLVLVVATVTVGNLDAISSVLTMFFLTTYLVLNLSAAIEAFLQSPSFRPQFRVHWSLSFLGAIGCLAIMLLIDPLATLVAAVFSLSLYFWLQRRELQVRWGDVRRGMWMMLVRMGLFQLEQHFRQEDPKNWRPNILVFSGAPTKRWSLIELADSLSQKRGLTTVATVLRNQTSGSQKGQFEKRIRNYLDKQGVQALVRVINADEIFSGAQQLVETYGLGSIMPNTVLMGDSESASHRESYCQMIRQIHNANRNLVIFRENHEKGFGRRRRIDIWWGGSMQANGGLMLLLAYMLRGDLRWREANIYLKLVVKNQNAVPRAREELNQLLSELRISAIPKVIVSEGRSFNRILKENSQRADLIFLGMAAPDDNFVEYYEELQQRVAKLPSTVFILASPNFSFSEVL